jgi:FkbM family methyltransferase
VYFVINGAEKVIAVEPHPGAYKEMLDNIRLNNLENIIVPTNAYLISERGRARLGGYEIKGSVSTHQNYDGEALVVTLNDVIERYGIGGDAVLKMDCEGCEYDIVLNDYVHVKLFDEVILEYHANVGGKPGKLLKVLSRDYRCRVVEKHGRNFGIIHCVRKW